MDPEGGPDTKADRQTVGSSISDDDDEEFRCWLELR
jgi:hypothetical protein